MMMMASRSVCLRVAPGCSQDEGEERTLCLSVVYGVSNEARGPQADLLIGLKRICRCNCSADLRADYIPLD